MPKRRFFRTYVMEKRFYTCKYCYNDWTLDEGFKVSTNQCKGCHDWDKEEPAREKAWEEKMVMIREMATWNFPYCPGDPHW